MTTQMNRSHVPARTLCAVGLAALALVFAACGDDDDETPTATASPTSGQLTPALTVTPGSDELIAIGNTSAGEVLTDAHGMTLYTFDNDTEGESSCTGSCATTWPPLITTENSPPSDIEGAQGEFTIITRDDGDKQIAYDGKPLYTYIGDTAAGDISGDGLNGVWHIATP